MASDDGPSVCHKTIHVDNTTLFPNTNPYGGIPTNLTVNLIGFILTILLFLILRRSSWRVINRIVRKDDMERWTHMFFSFTAKIISSNDDGKIMLPPLITTCTTKIAWFRMARSVLFITFDK